jgi:uncharacterized protein (TIGR03790 family)
MCAAARAALAPDEVLVVANGENADSVALAKFYLEQRKIPPQNLALVSTTTNYDISREDYDAQIALPLRQYMIEKKLHDRIRCICVVWGVPVRVAAPAQTEARKEVAKQAEQAAAKALERLVVDQKLLATVGKKFPEPQIAGLKPMSKLFESVPAADAKQPKIDELLKDLEGQLNERQAAMSSISEQSKQQIAYRQLMAIHLDCYGLQGLNRYVSTHKPAGAPPAEAIQKQLEEAQRRLNEAQKLDISAKNATLMLELADSIGGAVFQYQAATAIQRRMLPAEADATVDAELALLGYFGSYDLAGFLPNPLYWRQASSVGKTGVLMTARLDGPTAADATAMLKGALAAEKSGLMGTFYIDAGGKVPEYDQHLKKLQNFLTANTRLKVVMDEREAVFQPSSAPDAALYVGWYSLQKYVPAFTWVQGAVGWHIASWEAQHLRDPNSREWCPKMIQSGVSATIGAVNEPYLMTFPLPEEFFPLLLTGKLTLAEVYWRTVPVVSWRMTLLGDPLYTPFGANPVVEARHLPGGLMPS